MYTVKCDGMWLYNYSMGIVLINPKLSMADSAAGSFEFTMAPDHYLYDLIKNITSRVIVYRNSVEIWSGRPVAQKDNFNGERTVTCEGELAYLNDSVQPQAEFHDKTVRQWLTTLLNNHNADMDSISSGSQNKFYVGSVTVEDNLYRFTNRESTLECINDKLVSRLGGHLRVRKSGSTRYLDYLKDYPKTATQTIEFGVNLLDYSKNFDQNDIVTAVIPIGAALEDAGTIENLPNNVTVKTLNYPTTNSYPSPSGKEWVCNKSAVTNYGWVCKTITFDDVTVPANLYNKAVKYLQSYQYDNMILEIKAIDFNLVDNSVVPFDLLDEVLVTCRPHGIINKRFPITKMDIPLDDPANTVITLGKELNYKPTLTSKNNSAIQAILDKMKEITPASTVLKHAQDNATQLIISGALGSHVVVRPDEIYVMDTDNTSTARKVWRWNVNGLGYSSTGINGTYGTAITMDGRIVADYITTGTMSADRIKGGSLKLGGGDYGNGVIEMYNSLYRIGRWDSTGMYHGNIRNNLTNPAIKIDTAGRITFSDTTDVKRQTQLENGFLNFLYNSTTVGRLAYFAPSSGANMVLQLRSMNSKNLSVSSNSQLDLEAGTDIYLRVGSSEKRAYIKRYSYAEPILSSYSSTASYIIRNIQYQYSNSKYYAAFVPYSGTTRWAELTTSDRRIKKNIEDSKANALEKINGIRHVSFDYIEDGAHRDCGYIAQELKEVIPEAVFAVPQLSAEEGQPKELYQIDKHEVLVYATKAIQELSAKIDILEKELTEIKNGLL